MVRKRKKLLSAKKDSSFNACQLTEAEEKNRRKHISLMMMLLAVALIVTPMFFILKHRIENAIEFHQQQQIAQNQETITLALIYLKHKQGYYDYCFKQGYELEHYPLLFEKTFKRQKSYLEKRAKEGGFYSLHSLLKKLKKQFSATKNKKIENSFKNYTDLALSQGATIKKPYDLCEWLDNNAVSIFENDADLDMIKLKSLTQ